MEQDSSNAAVDSLDDDGFVHSRFGGQFCERIPGQGRSRGELTRKDKARFLDTWICICRPGSVLPQHTKLKRVKIKVM